MNKYFVKLFVSFLLAIVFSTLVYLVHDEFSYKSNDLAEVVEIVPSAKSVAVTKPEIKEDKISDIPSNVIGWIYIPGTNINYPIVQANDNSFYLNRNIYGNKDKYGSVFLDYRNTSDFNDNLNIIYGHNSVHSCMFSDLKQFANKDLASTKIYLATRESDFVFVEYSILCCNIFNEDDTIFNTIDLDVQSYVTQICKTCLYKNDYNQLDNVITLVTCYGEEGTDKRLALTITR